MNMNANPSKDELKAMIAACDDNAGPHMPWVGNDGEVHLELLADTSPNNFARDHASEIKFRMETYAAGNDYVGANAAADDAHVTDVFGRMVELWKTDARGMWRGDEGTGPTINLRGTR